MLRRALQYATFAFALFLLAACGGGEGSGGGGGCSAESLAAPVILSPASMEVVDSLTPIIFWDYSTGVEPYPYPGTACVPDGYHITVSVAPFYDVVLFEGDVPEGVFGWTTPALEPGNVYRVVVEARAGGASGPASVARKFLTGPVCTTEDLVTPVLVLPADGAVITDIAPTLKYDNPGACLVDGYRSMLSAEPAFAAPVFDQTFFLPLQILLLDPASLEPCRSYYWKVAALLGDETASTQSEFSPTWSFFYNPFGSCAPLGAPTTITGKVWHDLCALPEMGPLPDPLPFGCVPSGESAMADGILTIGEPGIEGVVVRMADGACPAAGTQALTTDEYGNYRFLEVDPGTYCISVDSLDTNNVDILIPGNWTSPSVAVGDQIAYREVVMDPDGAVTDVDFGWDYQFLPPWGDLSAISGKVWEDQCSYDGIGPVPDPLPEGCISWETGYVIGNGTLDPGEEPIEGLTVDLGLGDCPSAGLMTAVTDAAGQFSFEGLPPGRYCLRINAENEGNADILLPGRWSLVTSGHMGMTFQTVVLEGGVDALERNFAWDPSFPYYLGRIPWFRIREPAICRIGPGNGYPILDYLDPDWLLPVIGRDPDGDWFEVLMPDEPLDIPGEGLSEFLGKSASWQERAGVEPSPWQERGGVEPSPFQERAGIAPSPFGLDEVGGGTGPGEPPGMELISMPLTHRRCWVYFDLGDLLGGVGRFTLPVLPYPELVVPDLVPVPTPEPVVCTELGFAYCQANPDVCQWTCSGSTHMICSCKYR